MESKQIIRMALEEYYEELTFALDGLTSEERRFQPGAESHHIDFAVWHMARVEDSWIQPFARDVEQVWTSEGWSDKLGIPPGDGGYGYSADKVRNLPRFELSDAIDYYERVRTETFAYLDSLTDDDFDQAPGRGNWPEFTIGLMFSHLIVEQAQHTGQVAYLRGIQRGLGVDR